MRFLSEESNEVCVYVSRIISDPRESSHIKTKPAALFIDRHILPARSVESQSSPMSDAASQFVVASFGFVIEPVVWIRSADTLLVDC